MYKKVCNAWHGSYLFVAAELSHSSVIGQNSLFWWLLANHSHHRQMAFGYLARHCKACYIYIWSHFNVLLSLPPPHSHNALQISHLRLWYISQTEKHLFLNWPLFCHFAQPAASVLLLIRWMSCRNHAVSYSVYPSKLNTWSELYHQLRCFMILAI